MQIPSNPPILNLRSHHSLRNSSFNNNALHQYINPPSGRGGLTKKAQLNSRNDLNTTQNTIKNVTSQPSTDMKINYQKNGGISRNQMYISLGNKSKDNNAQFYIHQTHKQVESKIQRIVMEIQQQNKRLSSLQSRMLITNNQKVQINSLLNQYTSSWYADKSDIKSELFQIKNQLSRMMDRKQAEKRIQNYQMLIRQINLSFKNTLYQQTSKIQARVQKLVRKQVEKLNLQICEKINAFSTRLQEEKVKNKSQIYSTGSFNEKMEPLLKNPNLHLKFLSKISIFQAVPLKNPQKEQQMQEWVVEQHSSIYMVDKEGYLLDKDQRYLINQNGEMIKLNSDQIQILLNMNLMN